MTWQISIPHRSAEDPLASVAEAAHVLPADEARVVRRLVLGALVDGTAATVGDLLDRLEAMSPGERRKVLDDARVKAGLESASELEFRERHATVQRNAMLKASDAPPPRLAYSESGGGIVDLAEREQEAARMRAFEESLRRRREAEAAERAVEAEELRRAELARGDAEIRQSPQLRGFAA